jgi:hypothetical protein
MVSGIERRQEHPRPWRTRETTPEKATEGVRVNTSKVNESAPMIVRVAQGSLMAGHGAQKLFGSFGGPGLEGTSGFMEMLGMRPGRPWAYLAGLSEFGGGVLRPWRQGCAPPMPSSSGAARSFSPVPAERVRLG